MLYFGHAVGFGEDLRRGRVGLIQDNHLPRAEPASPYGQSLWADRRAAPEHFRVPKQGRVEPKPVLPSGICHPRHETQKMC